MKKKRANVDSVPTLPLELGGMPICEHLVVEAVDLRAPDYDEREDGPLPIPLALPACQYAGECMYKLIYAGNPWSPFDVFISCGGWEAAWANSDHTAWTLMPAEQWPPQPPTAPRPIPSHDDQLAIVWHRLSRPAELAEAEAMIDKRGYTATLFWLATQLRGRSTHYQATFPSASCTNAYIRVWWAENESRSAHTPDVMEPLFDFVKRFLVNTSPQQITMELL